MTAKAKQPKAYTAATDVFVEGIYTKAGNVFVTSDIPGDDWTEKTPEEAHIIEASTSDIPKDPPLESLGLEALKAVAVTKMVNVTGLSKSQLIDAIKAANEPAL